MGEKPKIGYDFIEDVQLKLKEHALFLSVKDFEDLLGVFNYTVNIDNGEYGAAYEFSVSRNMIYDERNHAVE